MLSLVLDDVVTATAIFREWPLFHEAFLERGHLRLVFLLILRYIYIILQIFIYS